jgi:hypothetical protein
VAGGVGRALTGSVAAVRPCTTSVELLRSHTNQYPYPQMIQRIPISLLAILSMAALAVGCGGSEGDSGKTAATASNASDTTTEAASSGKSLTKAEFVKAAEEVCRKAGPREYAEANAYANKHQKELNQLAPIPREEKMIRAIVLPSILRQLEELRAIGLPKGDEKQIKAIFSAIETGVEEARKNPYGIELEFRTKNPLAKADDLIHTYGLIECRNIS